MTIANVVLDHGSFSNYFMGADYEHLVGIETDQAYKQFLETLAQVK